MVDQDCVLFIFECAIKHILKKEKKKLKKRIKKWEMRRNPSERPNGPIAQPVRAHA